MLSPSTIAASTTLAGYSVTSLINFSGLFGNLHNTLDSDMWLADNINPGVDLPFGFVNFQFNEATSVRSLKIWNFNGNELSRGAKRVEIRYSYGGANVSAGIYTLSQGTGGALGGQIVVLPFDILAWSIQVILLENYGDANYVGLSEVQFYSENLLAEFESDFGSGGSGGSGGDSSGSGPGGTDPSGSGPGGTVPTGTTPTNVEEIPEPSSWLLFASGMALIGLRRR
jgi:hypothetical protein